MGTRERTNVLLYDLCAQQGLTKVVTLSTVFRIRLCIRNPLGVYLSLVSHTAVAELLHADRR